MRKKAVPYDGATDTYKDMYHVSPQVFESFDNYYIGTGERNHDFGWGFYFTDVAGIAGWYTRQFKRYFGSAHVYTIDFRPGIVLMDWHDPISDTCKTKLQPLFDYLDDIGDAEDTKYLRQCTTGDDIYSGLSYLLGSMQEASLLLLKFGISGNRYRPGTLSTGGAKFNNDPNHFNYVLFDDKAAVIKEVKTDA